MTHDMKTATIDRRELEKAWAAIGYMAFCGTLRNQKIGVCVRSWRGFNTYEVGDVVIFEPEGRATVTVSKACRPETHGSAGFIATYATTVCVPKAFVRAIDTRSQQIKETAKR